MYVYASLNNPLSFLTCIYIQVNDQISTRGGDAASVVLVLTDGDIKDQSQATVQVRFVVIGLA